MSIYLRPNHYKAKRVLFDYLKTPKTQDEENHNDFLLSRV